MLLEEQLNVQVRVLFSQCVFFYVNQNGLDSIDKLVFLHVYLLVSMKGFWNQEVVFLMEFYVNLKVLCSLIFLILKLAECFWSMVL